MEALEFLDAARKAWPLITVAVTVCGFGLAYLTAIYRALGGIDASLRAIAERLGLQEDEQSQSEKRTNDLATRLARLEGTIYSRDPNAAKPVTPYASPRVVP